MFKQMRINKKTIMSLAAEFGKDPRTIKKMIRAKSVLLLEHPRYKQILEKTQ